MRTNHEDKKTPRRAAGRSLSSLSIGNEMRKGIERARDEFATRIENKIDSICSDIEEDLGRVGNRIDKRLSRVEAKTAYILWLIGIVGIGGRALFFLLR